MFWLGIPGFNVILVIRHPGFLGARTTRKLSKTNINNYFKYPQRPYLKGDTLIQTNKISISMCQMILGVVHPLDHWICISAGYPLPGFLGLQRFWDRALLSHFDGTGRRKKTTATPNNAWEGWRWESFFFWGGKGIKELKFISRNIWYITLRWLWI